uniref:Uncharacterized protein n=1 Tax=Sphaerodactylus townsendi TaxID=933632 RepID=A0ACB8FWM2_9SAUR
MGDGGTPFGSPAPGWPLPAKTSRVLILKTSWLRVLQQRIWGVPPLTPFTLLWLVPKKRMPSFDTLQLMLQPFQYWPLQPLESQPCKEENSKRFLTLLVLQQEGMRHVVAGMPQALRQKPKVCVCVCVSVSYFAPPQKQQIDQGCQSYGPGGTSGPFRGLIKAASQLSQPLPYSQSDWGWGLPQQAK